MSNIDSTLRCKRRLGSKPNDPSDMLGFVRFRGAAAMVDPFMGGGGICLHHVWAQMNAEFHHD